MSNAITTQNQFKSQLTAASKEFAAALPEHITVKKFTRIVQTVVLSNPSLLNGDRRTLFSSCVQAAQVGLMPDGKEAALVPYGNKITFMPMIGGVLKLMRNSGEIASITSQMVHKNDEFEFYIDDDGEHLKHSPEMFEDRGDAIGVYALAKTKDGGVYIEVLSMGQINDIKASSRGKGGPWSGPFWTEMARKSAIRRLAKRLPMSTDIEAVVNNIDQYHSFEDKPAEKDPKPVNPNLAQAMGIDKSDIIDAESVEVPESTSVVDDVEHDDEPI